MNNNDTLDRLRAILKLTDADVADEPTDYDLRAANLDFPEGIADFAYAATIETIALAEPYRAPLSTPWPMMSRLKSSSRSAQTMSVRRKLRSIMPSISRNPWGSMTSGSRSWPMARALAS